MKTTSHRLLSLSIASCLAMSLSACGGGGGGNTRPTPTTPPPAATDPCVANPNAAGCTPTPPVDPCIANPAAPGCAPVTPTAWVNPGRVTIAGGADVLVGVVDGGFNTQHFEIKDRIAGTKNFSAYSSVDGAQDTDKDYQQWHGLYVAQEIAGDHVGYSGNSRLLLARADVGGASVGGAEGVAATTWAVQQGARVVNQSYSLAGAVGLFTTGYPGVADQWAAIVAADALIVKSAGNTASNLTAGEAALTAPTVFTAGNEALRDRVLIAGGIGPGSISDVPGQNAAIQQRFLMADWNHAVQSYDATAPATSIGGTLNVVGTSGAAPQVSAAAATLMSLWPSLSAPQVANLLLTTTDRSFTNLYDQNNCGPDGKVNCGLFSFGMGKLDLVKAMQPQGATVLAMSTSVTGASVGLDATHLTLPSAFGDAARDLGVSAMALDAYGRDYHFQLNALVSASPRWAAVPMLSASAFGGAPIRRDAEDAAYWMRQSSWGNPGALGFNVGSRVKVMGFTGAGVDGNAFDRPESMGGLNLLGYNGGTMASAVTLTGVGIKTGLGRAFSLEGHSVTGVEHEGQLARQEAAVGFQPTQALSVKLGYARQASSSALGAIGVGALQLGQSKAQSMTFGADLRLAGQWSAFMRGEVGRLTATPSQGLIQSLSVGRMSQAMAGLSWAGTDTQVAFVVAQPLRVDSASANLDVPVARTVDGLVLRRSQSVSLAPSGRQINAELALSHQINPRSAVQFNGVYARQPGHQANASPEVAVFARYAMVW